MSDLADLPAELPEITKLRADLKVARRSNWLLRISVVCLVASGLLTNWAYWTSRHSWLVESKATLARVEGLQSRVNGLQALVNQMAMTCRWRITSLSVKRGD